ncbi:39S ribosomal protein L51 [Tropilaelaps mercedesae]|uniref:Large ribosomal subunit protein mL51 n=1 Tax=Tropilaelaps mercedesae TaxID=418985 RepID=A0A1V9X6U1_9ACAR|nr:39S ribosomal protein L51 [Tropilaelaps mercedesae]
MAAITLATVKNATLNFMRGVRCLTSSPSCLSQEGFHVEPTKLSDLGKYETQSVRGNRPIYGLGYRKPPFTIGFLPRLDDMSKTIKVMDQYKPKNSWTERRALFGQNDYIDILGEPGKVRPTDNMTNVPLWLRGFQGNEFQMLMLKQLQYADWRITRPHRWKEMQKRIKFLYKRLNYKSPW